LGVSAAALLRHAPSKKALFALAMESEIVGEPLPADFLASVSISEDPARVLRRLALEFIPFIEQKMGENIARFLRARTEEEARTIRIPSIPERRAPPVRVIRALEQHFRARRRGRLLRHRGPALAFLVRSSPTSSSIACCASSADSLDAYLDTVPDIWKRGALRPERNK
jgi:AcrR family transcriptional regulator